MNIFKLLLKNAIRIIKKTKVLTIQLCVITLLAVTVITSIFISNKTLKNSYDKVKQKGNIADFSIENIPLQDKASFLIGKLNTDLKPYDNINFHTNYSWADVKTPSSNTENMIYTPYVEKAMPILDQNGQIQKSRTIYGYYNEYNNVNAPKEQWPGIVYSDLGFPISLNTDQTPIEYKGRVKNVFSFYKNVFPLSTEDVDQNKVQLYDLSNYSTNPWSFKLNPNGSLGYSEFGLASIDGFYNANTFSYNQGLIYSDWGWLVGTDKVMDKNISLQDINNIRKKIIANDNLWSILTSPSAPLGTTIQTNKVDYLDFQYGNLYQDNPIWNFYSNEFIQELSNFENEFKKNYLIQSPGYIELSYKIDQKNSNNKVKFINTLYNEKRLPQLPDPNKPDSFKGNLKSRKDNPLNTKLPSEIDPYFSSKIKIPLIPYINLKPVNNKFDIKNPATWKENSEIDNDNLSIIITNILNKLSKTIIQKCDDAFNFIQSDPKYSNLINEYNQTYNIKEMLEKHNVNFVVTSNLTTNNITGDNFIITSTSFKKASNLNPVNALVIKDGSNLYDEELDDSTIKKQLRYLIEGFNETLKKVDYDPLNIPKNVLDVLKLLSNCFYYDSEENVKQFYESIEYLMTKPDNTPTAINNYKTARTMFAKTYGIGALLYNGYGIDLKIKKQTIPGVIIEFEGRYVDKTSFLGVASENYEKIKTGEKKILSKEILNNVLKLPYSQRRISIEEINNNINKYYDNFILNPTTNKVEFYNDFLSWFSNLDPKYKLDTTGGEILLIGTGINPEFIYPILNKSEFIINNNNPVVFGNKSLFNKLSNFIKTDVQSNIWGRYSSSNYFTNNSTLKSINEWTKNLYHKNLAYSITDINQPNILLYRRINFPIQIMNTVFSLTIILAIIISVLSLFFIATLLRSIIKQNLNIIAISIANGISKLKIALSFFIFALIPGLISSLLAFALAQVVYPIINSSISDYWILQWDSSYFSAGLLFLLPLIVFGILFLILLAVIFITIRKNLTTLLTSHVEFRMNKLISWTKPLLSLISPLASFRISYVMGNITRFTVLLLMMTFFIVTASTFVSSISVFDNAIKQTLQNKKYTYAIDLLSPTEQGGYYYDIPINQIGHASQGLIPNLQFPAQGIYNQTDYESKFTYSDPLEPNNPNKQLLYNSLFAISADLVSEIHGNIQFFRNRILTRNTIDVNVNFLGNNINPWFFAQQTLPSNITSIADKYFNEITNTAFQYYLFIENQIDKKYEYEKNKKFWFLDDNSTSLLSDITDPKTNKIYTDPKKWNQENWIYQYRLDISTNKYKWQLNKENALTGLPDFQLKQKVVQLWINILSLNKNPNFIEFNEKRKLFNENFYLALNIIPFNKDLNETYTYIKTDSFFHKDPYEINIIGIKPNSSYVYLYNEYQNNKDIKDKLGEWENNHPNLQLTNKDKGYPVIINEVVSKKYNLHVGDLFRSNILNTYDRFVRKFNNVSDPNVPFEVIGITTSKSDQKIYTSQSIANKILGYAKPEKTTLSEALKTGNYDNKWLNQDDIDKYIPFNGVFTKEENTPTMLKNFATIYSLSGLSPLSGSLPDQFDISDATSQLDANWDKINKILHMNMINLSETKNSASVNKFISNYKNIFGSNKYIDLSIVNLDVVEVNKILGIKMDNTTKNIMLVIIISFLPTLMIIVSLLALMVVIESRRLISLLKVLGYGNISNAFSLTTSYFILLFLSLFISIGITQLILYSFSTLVFTSFNIIINPILIPWIFGATFGVLLLFVALIWIGTYFSIKNTNVPQVISVR